MIGREKGRREGEERRKKKGKRIRVEIMFLLHV